MAWIILELIEKVHSKNACTWSWAICLELSSTHDKPCRKWRRLRRSLTHEFFKAWGNLSTRCALKCREGSEATPGTLIGTDEFPAGYSLAGCAPAEPASASLAQKEE